MQVLVVLFGSLVLYRAAGTAGVSVFSSWIVSARFALATMLVFTGASHFAPMRKDLIAMVPPGLPRPDLLVFATGVLEVAGAAGLLFEAAGLLFEATRFSVGMRSHSADGGDASGQRERCTSRD